MALEVLSNKKTILKRRKKMKKLFHSSYQNAITWLFTGLLGFFALILSTTLVAQENQLKGLVNNLYVNAENDFQRVNGEFTQVSMNEIPESPDSIYKRKDDSEDNQLHSKGLGAGWGSVSRVLP